MRNHALMCILNFVAIFGMASAIAHAEDIVIKSGDTIISISTGEDFGPIVKSKGGRVALANELIVKLQENIKEVDNKIIVISGRLQNNSRDINLINVLAENFIMLKNSPERNDNADKLSKAISDLVVTLREVQVKLENELTELEKVKTNIRNQMMLCEIIKNSS